MSEPRVIKRYANRKLYDTSTSRYVTLDQIAELVRTGDEVQVVDNTSREDLTSVTLAQIVFEEEKKQRSFLPLGALRNIIQTGGVRLEEIVSQAKGGVTGVIARVRSGAPESGAATPVVAAESAPAVRESKEHRENREGLKALREVREWLEGSQRTIEDWQKRIDERVRNVVVGISPFSGLQKEVTSLSARIADLERRLEQASRSTDRRDSK